MSHKPSWKGTGDGRVKLPARGEYSLFPMLPDNGDLRKCRGLESPAEEAGGVRRFWEEEPEGIERCRLRRESTNRKGGNMQG